MDCFRRNINTILEGIYLLLLRSPKFYATKFLPIFEKHAEGEGRYFLFVRDDQESLGDKYSVEIFPTVLFFENGAVSKRLDGVPKVGLTEKQLVDFMASCP